MMPRVVILLVALAVLVLYNAAFTIDETEVAIVTQFGKFERSISEPGLQFKKPFLQSVHRRERRIIGQDTDPGDYLTLDKKKLVADPVARWRIADPLVFYQKLNNIGQAAQRLDDIVKSEMRREISSHDFGDIVGSARAPLMAAVTDRVREKATEYGVHVVDVRIKRADLPRDVQESVFQRMRAERDREAKRYRSEGAEEAAKIRAETDKEVEILIAEAERKAAGLKGEGDAESTRVFADAYTKDEDFYALVRTLEAYEKSVTPETQVVLGTGSGLFEYMSRPNVPGRRR